MVFDEEGEWHFEPHKQEYSFFPEFEEEASIEVQQVPHSPTSPTFEDTSSERVTTRTRSLQDLYDNTEPLSSRRLEDLYEETGETNNHTLLCLSASYEPVKFEEAAQEKRRRYPTNKEVEVIKKDSMWNKKKKNVKEKVEGHKARLVAKGYNKKVNYDKVFIPSRSPGYHKAREVFPFEWSPQRRIGIHQANIRTQGEKKRRLGGSQDKG